MLLLASVNNSGLLVCLIASFSTMGTFDMHEEARGSNRGWNEQTCDFTERNEEFWKVFSWGTEKLVPDYGICLVRKEYSAPTYDFLQVICL